MKITRFEKAERFRTLNRTAQTILFSTACLLAFFLSWRLLPVIDITREGRYSLTPETVAYLRTLPKEVEIIGSLALGEEGSLGSDRLHELQNLTARYASVGKNLKVKWVDGFRAQSEFGFKTPYRMLVRNGDASVWITPEDLYLPQDDVFLGERALTSALWRLSNPSRRTIAVVVDKERYAAEGNWGFKHFQEFLAAHNADTKLLSASDLSGELIPCDAIFVLGGSDVLTTGVLSSLQRTLNDRKSNLFIAIDELAGEPLVRFLYFNGVVWPAERVEEREPTQKTPLGEMLIRDFEKHPVTSALIRDERMVLSRGHWWALEARGAMIDATVTPLLRSSAKSAAEGSDKKGPFVLMMAVEKKFADETSARILVAGSSDFLANAYLSYRGNQALLEGCFDYLCGENTLLSIPARTRQARQLGLNSVQLWRMGGWMLGASLVLLAVGAVKWLLRPR